MSGLNPPLSDISDSATTTSINCSSDILLEAYPTFSEDYENTIPTLNTDDTSLDKLPSTSKLSPTICSNNNPFLSQTRLNKDIILSSLKNESDQIKYEISSNNNK